MQYYNSEGYEACDLPPVFSTYFVNVYLPAHPGKTVSDDFYRELRTLATAMDELLRGRNLYAAGILSQRFKAIQKRIRDGHWAGAKWPELIPPSRDALSLAAAEDEVAQDVEVNEARAVKLLTRARG